MRYSIWIEKRAVIQKKGGAPGDVTVQEAPLWLQEHWQNDADKRLICLINKSAQSLHLLTKCI